MFSRISFPSKMSENKFYFYVAEIGISLCHISYLNFQCIFEFDKNDFACKGHMVLTNDSRFIKIKHDHLIYNTR